MAVPHIEQQMVVGGELILIASEEHFTAFDHSLFMDLLEG
jgi:hypothetical protein